MIPIWAPHKRTVSRYINGHCGVLAWSLWKQNGKRGSIVLIGHFSNTKNASHAVYEYGTTWIDIKGRRSRVSVMTEWAVWNCHHVLSIDPDEFYTRFIVGNEFMAGVESLPAARRMVREHREYFYG